MAPHLKGKISLDSKEARDAVRGLERSVNKFKKNVGAPLAKIGKMAAVAGLAVGAMGVAMINSVSKAGDAMDKMSKRTGIGTDELSRYAHAAALSGGSIDGMEKSLKSMGTALYEAKRGTKTYTDALGDLGLSFAQLEDLDPAQRFDLILSRLADIDDASIKSALALKVFGRNGIQLLPMLSAGAAGLKEMKEEADRLGIVFSAEQAASSARFIDEITRLKGSFQGLIIEGTNLEDVSDSVVGLTSSIVALRESGAFEQITMGFLNLAAKGIGAINGLVDGFNTLTDSERDAMKNASIAFVGISVAFKAGLLIPLLRGLATLVAGFATASATIATILGGLAGVIAAYNFGDAIAAKFDLGGKGNIFKLENKMATMRMHGQDKSKPGQYRQLEKQLELEKNKHLEATTQMAGKHLGEVFVENMADSAKKFLPEQFTDLFTGAGKLFDIKIPDIPELTQSGKLAGDFSMAEEHMANIASMAAPLRGFVTGGLSINHELSGRDTNADKRDTETSQTAKDQLSEQQKNNILMAELISKVQSGGSFSFGF